MLRAQCAAAALLCWPALAAAVSIPVVVGPAINRPLVTVRVCDDGGTCVTVPRVLLDTASVGLRLFDPAPLALLHLSPVRLAAEVGRYRLATCTPLSNGRVWGSLYLARVGIGELLTTSPIPVQFVGDPLLEQTPLPARCAEEVQTDAVARLAPGVAGILGIAPLPLDCGIACMGPVPPPRYFELDEDGELHRPSPTAVWHNRQLRNPLDALPAPYNSGASLQLPALFPGGEISAIGTLTLGIGAEAGNPLPPGSVYIATDRFGRLTARVGEFGAIGEIDSRLDSATPRYGIPHALAVDLPELLPCAGLPDYFCPQAEGVLAVTLWNYAVQMHVADAAAQLGSGRAALPALGGAPLQPGVLELGMPFFYGRWVGFEVGTSLDQQGHVWLAPPPQPGA